MKILHVINGLGIGGAERLTVDLTLILKKRGYEVDVLLLKDTDTYLKTELVDSGITVNYLTERGSIYNLFLLFKLVKYIIRYDIVHSHLFPAQYWVIMAHLLSSGKAKLITTEHNTGNRRRNHFFLKYVDRLVYSRYKKIITVSNKANEMLLAYTGNKQNILCITNGIDVKRISESVPYNKQELLGISDDRILLVMVAGFRIVKRQDAIIRTLTHLPENYHLALVGDGQRLDICKSLVCQLALENRVHFLGIRQDVGRILKTADIVILSSTREGLSLSSIEGMAAGKPFIGSSVAGIVEVVKGAGILFEAGDHKELSSIIKNLIQDKTYYNSVAKACFNRALLYDVNRLADKYIDVYNLLKNNNNEG